MFNDGEGRDCVAAFLLAGVSKLEFCVFEKDPPSAKNAEGWGTQAQAIRA